MVLVPPWEQGLGLWHSRCHRPVLQVSHMEGDLCFFCPSLAQSRRSGNCRALCIYDCDKQAWPLAHECQKYVLNSLFPRNCHCHFLVASPFQWEVYFLQRSFLDSTTCIKRMIKYTLRGLRICPIDNIIPQNLQLSEYTYKFSLTIKG